MSAAAKPRSPTPSVAGALRIPSISQFVRFAVVGAGGYVVNLAVFALLVDGAGIDYRAAGVLAFLVAVANNFHWNRRWTFATTGPGALRQAWRFLVVSSTAALLGLGLLTVLVGLLGVEKLAAQAIATVSVLPVSFAGNRLWTFGAGPRAVARFDRRERERRGPEMRQEPIQRP
ncbi:GtrA family protein [Capillimicrobium parvum]|uniref:GtrA family protein n=1 Tax=Capillimicrobium parvum TaxID=2884022 RepID=UPI00216B07A4|nr:GtrA family protein [Capillimicrobium parvum]